MMKELEIAIIFILGVFAGSFITYQVDIEYINEIQRKDKINMEEIVLNVEGMHCNGCENRVKNSLSQIDGVQVVKADHNNGTIAIKANSKINIDEIKEKIEDLGFEVK